MTMKYVDVVNSPNLRDYFGKRSAQWILELFTSRFELVNSLTLKSKSTLK